MEFSLSDEQKLIIESAARFGQLLRDKLRDTEQAGISADLADKYDELGYLKLDWSETHCGSQMGRLAKLMALEEMAYGDAAATLALDRVSLVFSPLLDLETISAKTWKLVQSGGKDFVPVYFVDVDGRLTLKDGKLSGAVPYLPADRCSALFVLQGSDLHLVEDGIETERVLVGALDGAGRSKARIDSKPAWSVSLKAPEALRLAGLWRLYLAAILLGVSRAAADYARQYCLDRVAFGKKVAHHQAVSFTLVDMVIAIEAARMVVHQAAYKVDAGQPALEELQAAFLQASECALFVTNYAAQFLASAGYVRDYPVEKWFREARALTLLAGGHDAAQMDAGQALVLSLEAA